jgi:DNA-binding GntR family transcriptional regulator
MLKMVRILLQGWVMSEHIITAVLEYIRIYQEDHSGFSPSQREIAQGCSISMGAMREALDILEARGKIARIYGVHRGILFPVREG